MLQRFGKVKYSIASFILGLIVGIIFSCTILVLREKDPRKYARQECRAMIEWLELEHASKGRYPVFLPLEHKRLLHTFDPPGVYTVMRDETAYSISFGDYGEDGYTLTWYSGSGSKWHWDQ